MAHGIATIADLTPFAGQERVKVITTQGDIVEIARVDLVPGVLAYKYVAVLS